MPFVTQNNFELVQKALADQPEALAALGEGRACPEQIAAAQQMHANDDIEIDEDASVSDSDEGFWVSAWVWVPNDEEEIEDE